MRIAAKTYNYSTENLTKNEMKLVFPSCYSDEIEKYAFEYKTALEYNGLMDKMIVFSHEKKYLELFKNRVLIDIDFKLDTSKNEVIWWYIPCRNT